MAILTAESRKKLPDSVFALPGRRYPIHDEAHARDALARASANATPAEQATIRAKVKAKYPGIKVSGPSKSDNDSDDNKDGQANLRKMYK